MSPSAATATAPSASDNRDAVTTSQLERVIEFGSAHWLPSLLSDLRSLELSGVNVPGIGDFRVAASTADHVRRLVAAMPTLSLPEPKLSPFSGGGIALTFSSGNKELTFTAYPNHEDFVFSLINENEDISKDGAITLEHHSQLVDLLKAIVG